MSDEETCVTTYNHDAAAELAQAESVCREWLPFSRDGEAICWVMVEYDRRAAEIEELRAQLVQAHALSTGARSAVDTLRAENERFRSQRSAALVLAKNWVHGTKTLVQSAQPGVAARGPTSSGTCSRSPKATS